MVERAIKKITREEMVTAIKTIKPEKTAVPFEERAEMISACGEVGLEYGTLPSRIG